MALIRPIPSGVNVTKLSEVGFTRDSSGKIVSADLSSLYSNYQNLTIDNIICQLKSTNVGQIISDGTTLSYSYDSSTGIITISATVGMWAPSNQTKFDVFIVR